MLQKKKQTKKMQMHIDTIYSFLDEHLPYSYAENTYKLLKNKGVENLPSKSTIRKVRTRVPNYFETRLDILNALVEIATKNKKEKEALLEKVSA